MKRIGLCITARLGSTRLKRKHLLSAGGKTMLEWLIQRINEAFIAERAAGDAVVIITTTQEPENEDFKAFTAFGADVFCGSKDNIPLRHYQAAVAYELTAIVSVDGDDILCPPEALHLVYSALRQGVKAANTTGFPLGMNVWGYQTNHLLHCLSGHEQSVLETGWGRIFPKEDFTTLQGSVQGWNDKFRYTLDYADDYIFFKSLIECMGASIVSASAQEIVNMTLKHAFFKLNEHHVLEYWNNFTKAQQQDITVSRKTTTKC